MGNFQSKYKRYKTSYDSAHKKYVAANRERLLAANRERYKNDEEFRESRKAYAKNYRAKHREKCNESVKLWKRSNRNRVRGYEIKRLYGITGADFALQFAKQEGKCPICLEVLDMTPASRFERRPTHIDHDHATGKFRGILCNECNLLVGQYELMSNGGDKIKRLVEYLNASR